MGFDKSFVKQWLIPYTSPLSFTPSYNNRLVLRINTNAFFIRFVISRRWDASPRVDHFAKKKKWTKCNNNNVSGGVATTRGAVGIAYSLLTRAPFSLTQGCRFDSAFQLLSENVRQLECISRQMSGSAWLRVPSWFSMVTLLGRGWDCSLDGALRF